MKRVLIPEQMDNPELPDVDHREALRGLARINALSRAAAPFWPPIRALAREHAGGPLRILDVAAGGGDVLLALRRAAARDGLALELHACDISGRAMRFAREAAHASGAELHTFVHDITRAPLPERYDAIVSSLFLHHLPDADARRALEAMSGAAQRLLLVSDLRRTTLGWLAACLGTRVLSRSSVVHFDGPNSVRAARTPSELRRLAEEAGLAQASVRAIWPWRVLLSWRPDA